MPPPTLTITGVAAGGDGIARDADGRVVFVAGALPGEAVTVHVGDQRRDFARASVIEVVDPSPDRVGEPCPHRRAGCGGCGWMHVERTAQHRLKRDIVADALARLAHLDPELATLAPPSQPGLGRTTVRAATRRGRAAFHRLQSDDTVSVEHCPAAHPLIDELLAHTYDGNGQVLLRVGARTGDRLVDGRGARIVDPPSGTVLGARSHVDEIVSGHRFRVSARSFFQASPEAAEALIGRVSALIGPDRPEHLVDAYGGVGLFAATIPAAHVTLIETSREATADARHNLRDREARIVTSEVARWAPEAADVVVADPARPGLGRRSVEALTATGAPVLVLVSCDAASMARDARLLVDQGFTLERVEVLDLFPDTPHVEVVSRFAR